MNFLKHHFRSYQYALRGVFKALGDEINMRVQALATLVVLGLNVFFDVSRLDWILTLALIGLMWMAELFNTAVEKLADRITREQDPLIGDAKDIAAGAVLVMGVVAAVCGVIIYWPYLNR